MLELGSQLDGTRDPTDKELSSLNALAAGECCLMLCGRWEKWCRFSRSNVAPDDFKPLHEIFYLSRVHFLHGTRLLLYGMVPTVVLYRYGYLQK